MLQPCKPCFVAGCSDIKPNKVLPQLHLIISFGFSNETFQCILWLTAEQLCVMVLSTKVNEEKDKYCVGFCDFSNQVD